MFHFQEKTYSNSSLVMSVTRRFDKIIFIITVVECWYNSWAIKKKKTHTIVYTVVAGSKKMALFQKITLSNLYTSHSYEIVPMSTLRW